MNVVFSLSLSLYDYFKHPYVRKSNGRYIPSIFGGKIVICLDLPTLWSLLALLLALWSEVRC